jgi:hypothetical protein
VSRIGQLDSKKVVRAAFGAVFPMSAALIFRI